MQFRWAIGIALWTILSGPIFAPPQSVLRPSPPPAAAATERPEAVSSQTTAAPSGQR